jgi:tRNA(fMet)-specific endonuclease VapC
MTGLDVLFDTNAVASLMKDPAIVAAVLPKGVRPAISLFSLGELKFGVLNSTRVAENVAGLERALADFRWMMPDAVTADVYADVRTRLKRKGRPIPANDIWIAALALQHGLPLLTHDAHFREVDGLTVVTW